MSKVRWVRKTKPAYHDAKEAFPSDVTLVIFIDLDYLLNTCADGNEKSSRLGQLVDQLLWDCRGSRSNVNTVVGTTGSMACGRR